MRALSLKDCPGKVSLDCMLVCLVRLLALIFWMRLSFEDASFDFQVVLEEVESLWSNKLIERFALRLLNHVFEQMLSRFEALSICHARHEITLDGITGFETSPVDDWGE